MKDEEMKPGVPQEVIFEVIKNLENQHGTITNEIVLAEAEKEESPIHDCFSWNDAELARERRLQIAGQLIRSVKVKFIGERRKTPLYVKVTAVVGEKKVRTFFNREHSILSKEQLQENIKKEFYREMNSLRKKYINFRELLDEYRNEILEK